MRTGETLSAIKGRLEILEEKLIEHEIEIQDSHKRKILVKSLVNEEWDEIVDLKDEKQANVLAADQQASRTFLETYKFLLEREKKRKMSRSRSNWRTPEFSGSQEKRKRKSRDPPRHLTQAMRLKACEPT